MGTPERLPGTPVRKKKSEGPLLGQVFRKLAPKIGADIVIEPEWRIVGQIIFKNGRKRYFRGSTLDLNPVGASDIAKDKDYAAYFMKRMGYPVAPGKTFFSPTFARSIRSNRSMEAAYRYARRVGFPVVVKPNSGSQGAGVAKVYTKRELYKALRFVFRRDRVALVQAPLTGKDYRVVVLDDRVISAYERIPLNVMGDGKRTVRQLLAAKRREFIESGRDTILKPKDDRIVANLKRQKLSMSSIVPKSQQIFLLDNANLSTGGDSVDVTRRIHPEFARIAVRLTADMGLRLCGVDFIVDTDITRKPNRYWILEVNAAPGLDHYVKSGKEQERIVEAMYLKVLKAMQ